ncbi:esterase [Dokdonia sinensis]|uniref:Esterase n=1 Tax=Dokdonia sinensis TaxID=2479847 RepID=A0A3M0FW24_9FLAO|nr:esterase [Dokdonia sinensis]RMB56970.1 esterase [Dokdonia sinensis]
MQENQVSYNHTNSYTTLNTYSEKTTTVWLAFHGMGYLSKYFIKYFKDLDPEENYIIAPQAPSKYYQDKKFKYVGASWLTKENTDLEKENIYNYMDAVWHTESSKWKGQNVRLIFMGYSQGVSIVTRWMAFRKIQCDYLLLHSGAIPQELEPSDFHFLSPEAPVTYLYGNKDEYITEARKTEQQIKGNSLFGNRLQVEVFDGVHEVNADFLITI